MARVLTVGHEARTLGFTQQGITEGFTGSTNPAVIDTTVFRSGSASAKCASTGANGPLITYSVTSNSGVTRYWMRAWIMVNGYPSAATGIMALGGSNVPVVSMTPSGTVRVFSPNGSQVGSESAVLDQNTWHLIEHGIGSTTWGQASTTNYIELRVDGVQYAYTTTDASTFLPGSPTMGWNGSTGNTVTLWVDDVAINDNSGSWEKSWPGSNGRVLIGKAARPIAKGNWTSDKNTTTDADMTAAVSNTPPIGIADTTASATPHQIRCATAASTAAPNYFEVEYPSYARIGVPGNVFVDTPNATYFNLGNAAAQTQQAQAFYLTGTLSQVALSLRTVGTPTDTVVLSVYAGSANAPTGAALAQISVQAASLSGTAAWIVFGPTDLPLTSGAQYFLVLSRSGAIDAANYYQIQQVEAGAYYDGGTATYNGSAWGALTATANWAFRCYSSTGNATIDSVHLLIADGEGVATGTKTGTLGSLSPAITAVAFTFGQDVGAAGTFSTNWNWHSSAYTVNVAVPSMATAPRGRMGKTDSGTRAALCCALFLLVEYTDPQQGWVAYTRNSDSAAMLAKYAPTGTVDYQTDETEVQATAGTWLVAGNTSGDVDRTTINVIDDTTFRSGYTPT